MTIGIQRMSHLGLNVGDLQASLAFYVDLLGFEKFFERDFVNPQDPEAKTRLVGLRTPGGTLAFELIEVGGGGNEVDGSGSPVLAFSVPDIAEAHRRIEAAGQPVLMPPTEMAPGVTMLFVSDPDGRTVECVEFATGATHLVDNIRREDEASGQANASGAGANPGANHDQVRACHHIGIAVHDLEAARKFYGQALGLEELERPEEIQQFTSAWYRLGISELHVVENKAFVPNKDMLAPHVAVAVRREDFDEVANRIRNAGFEFGFGPATGIDGIHRAVTEDPTGNRVEITAGELRRTSV